MKTQPQATESTHFESLYPADSRSAEVTKTLEFIKKGNSVQVVGLPGVGRSNLLRLLAYNNAVRVKHLGDNYKWFHFVYMDLSEVKGRSLLELTKFILISLSYSFSERKMDEEQNIVNANLKEAVSIQDDLVLFQALKKTIDYLSLEKELTIIFLFDRFDTFIPQVTQEFFTNLRVLRSRVKYRFYCVFSLPRPLEEILEPTIFSEFYEFLAGNTVYLSLSDPDANSFRFAYLEKASRKTLDNKIKSQIIELTGGHGKLSRICLETLLAEDSTPQNLSEFLLSKKQVQGALFEIWNVCTPQEQKFLFKKDFNTIEKDSYLLLSGLVKDSKIQIPLFEQNLANFPQPATETIVFFPETNEIKQGEETLTEKLSPSEFKLFRFLIQNKDRVCEKEEIINSVWSDAKTQEGVTDQALDQIIYRLRKKVEEDPNNPVHIHTVKGRGYRFS